MTKLEMFRGDDKTYNITFTDSDGEAIDITGYTIFFTVKDKRSYVDDADDTNALIEKEITVHTSPTEGQTQIVLDATDTNSMVPKTYVFDMQLKDANAKLITFIKDDFELKADVTRRSE